MQQQQKNEAKNNLLHDTCVEKSIALTTDEFRRACVHFYSSGQHHCDWLTRGNQTAAECMRERERECDEENGIESVKSFFFYEIGNGGKTDEQNQHGWVNWLCF